MTTFENQEIIAFSMMQKCNMSEASLRFFPNNCCRETVESLRHLVVRGRQESQLLLSVALVKAMSFS